MFRMSLSHPLLYSQVDDGKFYLALVKGILDHGWWTQNSSLGFPFGQQLYDFPQGADGLNLVAIRVLGLFSSNPAWVANVFLLVTFGAVALSAFAVLRLLGLSRAASVMGGVIFSLLPYHFWRGESQLLLSAYYSVPASAYLFLRLQDDGRVFARREGSARVGWSWVTRRSTATVLVCAIIGSAGLYYAAFGVVVILTGAVVRLVVIRRAAAVVPSLVVAGLIALALSANLAPALVYRAEHGANPRIHRTVADSKGLGLQLAGLVLPVRDHRVVASDWNAAYFDSPVPGYCEPCYETLGTVGDVGFGWLVVIALASVLGFAGLTTAGSLARRAALGVALSLLLATLGGLSGLIALFVSTDLRAWNRMSLFVAFFSLLAAGLLLDGATRWLHRCRAPAWAGPVLIGAVLVFGILDETSRSFQPRPGPTRLEWRSDATFTRQIEARMPANAAIFQIPQVPFPEGYSEPAYTLAAGGGFATSYELMRGYLHATGLRWSYGAMKGRPADWASQLVTKPLGFVANTAAIDGFDGLWVDLVAYGQLNRDRIKRQLQAITGEAPRLSPLRDLAFYDLRALRTKLTKTYPASALHTLRNKTLHPLRATCTLNGLQLTNPSTTARTATLTYGLSVRSGEPHVVVIRYPNATVNQIKFHGRRTISKRLILPPGTHTIRFFYAGQRVLPTRLSQGPEIQTPILTEPDFKQFELPSQTRSNVPAGRLPPACVQSVPITETPRREF